MPKINLPAKEELSEKTLEEIAAALASLKDQDLPDGKELRLDNDVVAWGVSYET